MVKHYQMIILTELSALSVLVVELVRYAHPKDQKI